MANNGVQLAIADNGRGMSEEVLRHVCEPFLTTKPIGQGTRFTLDLPFEPAQG